MSFGKSRLAILVCLGLSLGQAPTSAKSESDWIHFCHAASPQGNVVIPAKNQI